MIEQHDTDFMARAIELAELGRGSVSPNPLVGALVVKEGKIIGRGYHRRAGEKHAEVLALREAGEQARGATLYVTLEPCCHHGKTPPCTDVIITSGITRVVAAVLDPNTLMCGRGVACLRDTGVEVVIGVLEKLAHKQNETFFKYIRAKLPFVTVKLAATLDGMIAAADGSSRWLTGEGARKQVHRMRSWSDAVMVGGGTVLADDPSLTVSEVEGADPLRVIIDSRLRTPVNAKVVGKNTVICVSDTIEPEKMALYTERGAEIWAFPGMPERISLEDVLRKLGEHTVTSVLCEGGSLLASALFREQMVDKLVYIITPKLLGDGLNALSDLGIETLGDAVDLTDVFTERFGEDIFYTGYPVFRSEQ